MGILGKLFGGEKSDRARLLEQFDGVYGPITEQMPEVQQIAVGNGINMANTAFTKRFSGTDGFLRISKIEQNQYILQLNDAANKMSESRGDNETALGFLLFKYWIAAVAEQDKQLVDHFGAGLANLSKKADF